MELFDLDSIKVNSIFWLISFILFSGIKSNSHPVEAETILYWKTLNRYFPTTNCKLKKKNFQPVLKPTLNTASILKRDTSKSRDQDCRLQTNSKPKNTGQETKVLGNPLWRENEINSRVLKMS